MQTKIMQKAELLSSNNAFEIASVADDRVKLDGVASTDHEAVIRAL